MKIFSVVSAILMFVVTAFATAQTNVSNVASTGNSNHRAAESKEKLDDYLANGIGSGSKGKDMLEEAELKRLPKTPENIVLVRRALASKITEDEKVGLYRLLASLHDPIDGHKMNKQIETDLRTMIYQNQKKSSRAAVLAFIRTGYYKDSPAILSYAKLNNLIVPDEYYGELSYLLSVAPPEDHVAIVSEIRAGKNRYAAEILASTTPMMNAENSIQTDTQAMLLSILLENEPKMPISIGDFGYTDAVRYANWLNAVAIFESKKNGIKYEDSAMKRLNDNSTDSRKIIAFFISDEGKAMMQKSGKRSSFEPAFERVALYSKQLPGSQIMRESVSEIKNTLSLLKQ